MSFLSSVFSGNKPTKYIVACRVSALLCCVIKEGGVNSLVSGIVILNNDWTVKFQIGDDKIGIVLAATKIKPLLTENEIKGLAEYPYVERILDALTSSVIKDFERRSEAFAQIEKLFRRKGNYVFVGKSAKYWDAERRGDKEGMNLLLLQEGKFHYLMETHESMGEATLRSREMADAFPGGVSTAFEFII